MLLAYAKLSLYSELLDSKVPDDPYLGRELGRYFPKLIAEKYPDALEKHRLRREIIATQLANSMINRGGPSLVVRIADQTGASPAAIAFAFAAVRNSYDMPALNDEINALDGKVPGKVQLELYAAVQDLLLDRLVWFLRNVDLTKGLAGVVEHYREGIAALAQALDKALPKEAAAARAARMARSWSRPACPRRWPRRIGGIPEIAAAPDVVLIADRTKKPIAAIVATYFAAEAYFRVDRVVAAAREHRRVRLLRPAGARPRARFDRRRRTAIDRGDGGDRRDRRSGGRGLGQAAPGRGRAHSRGDPPDRGQWADAVEADGGGEPAGRSGEGLIAPVLSGACSGRTFPPREGRVSPKATGGDSLQHHPTPLAALATLPWRGGMALCLRQFTKRQLNAGNAACR